MISNGKKRSCDEGLWCWNLSDINASTTFPLNGHTQYQLELSKGHIEGLFFTYRLTFSDHRRFKWKSLNFYKHWFDFWRKGSQSILRTQPYLFNSVRSCETPEILLTSSSYPFFLPSVVTFNNKVSSLTRKKLISVKEETANYPDEVHVSPNPTAERNEKKWRKFEKFLN